MNADPHARRHMQDWIFMRAPSWLSLLRSKRSISLALIILTRWQRATRQRTRRREQSQSLAKVHSKLQDTEKTACTELPFPFHFSAHYVPIVNIITADCHVKMDFLSSALLVISCGNDFLSLKSKYRRPDTIWETVTVLFRAPAPVLNYSTLGYIQKKKYVMKIN